MSGEEGKRGLIVDMLDPLIDGCVIELLGGFGVYCVNNRGVTQ